MIYWILENEKSFVSICFTLQFLHIFLNIRRVWIQNNEDYICSKVYTKDMCHSYNYIFVSDISAIWKQFGWITIERGKVIFI